MLCRSVGGKLRGLLGGDRLFLWGGFFSGFRVFGVIGWVGFMSVNECMLFFLW